MNEIVDAILADSRGRIDATAVISCHKEGPLAHRTLKSIERCRVRAVERGLEVQFVITLDCADAETRRVVTSHPALREGDEVIETGYGDPSLARNHGIGVARGEYVGVFDGDDLFSENWIAEAIPMLKSEGPSTIVHPHMLVAFGAWNSYWWQVDQLSEYYKPRALLSVNLWNTCAFAYRRVFVECPYRATRARETGFGYEDWQWNCDTLGAGYVHRLVPGTVRFERRKWANSQNEANHSVAATLQRSPFFDQI